MTTFHLVYFLFAIPGLMETHLMIAFSPSFSLSRPDTAGGKETGAAKVSKNLI